ncbi:DUF2891 domain-containing protein [Pedobacter deserti]|uniref:DUF2891 domain-containing protein n=1 Tax=Pedobacter deserti TaxID=2817382 RepID=UPI00210D3454|nr:DUF2891 domain-containing protein [Pedobacter sp. SYSU D00382]
MKINCYQFASFLAINFVLLFPDYLLAQSEHYTIKDKKYTLTLKGASHFAALPLKCMQAEFPYKTGITFTDTSMTRKPRDYHPAFYGCYDWHSSVHGHWMLVRLLKLFPTIPEASEIRSKLNENLSAENIIQEIKIFEGKDNKAFERTYGWAWLLQLQTELDTWNDPLGTKLQNNLRPLANKIASLYIEYLPKMSYAVRSGEHSNLAFGLKLAWEYARNAKNQELQNVVKETAVRFYQNDANCPFNWEPGGADFLSPCLEEADLMARVLTGKQFEKWFKKFLPSASKTNFNIIPGEVKDRSDGKLVHLDGLNLSRASALYNIGKHYSKNQKQLFVLANKHLSSALPNVASGDYMGEHWLASFAVYALTMQ